MLTLPPEVGILGEVAERPKALDSKSSRLQNSLVGSNPTLSAKFRQ